MILSSGFVPECNKGNERPVVSEGEDDPMPTVAEVCGKSIPQTTAEKQKLCHVTDSPATPGFRLFCRPLGGQLSKSQRIPPDSGQMLLND
jgi:hypothetical protein